MKTNLSAHVEHPNTPESDKQDRVWHIVHYTEDGEKQQMQVYATDPLDAIDTVRKRD
jgi:hypothetical protein